MIYYHGTDQYFEAFVLNKSRTYMDFGSGIYLSEKLDHAKRVALWKNGEHAYVYTYKVNLTELKQQFHVKEFRSASIEWSDLLPPPTEKSFTG